MTLFLRDVEIGGVRTDVHIEGGRIAAMGSVPRRSSQEIDGRGGALLPGLIDHHIHLFATAARLASVDLSEVAGRDALLSALREAADRRAPGAWIRATGYDDTGLGLLNRDDLDRANIPNPVRVQDRTGALWVLNSLGLDRVGQGALPDCVERGEGGRPTGRIWRGDPWLRERIGAAPPSLAPLSRQLARCGITGLTDASVTNGPEEARLLARARADGALLQSLCLMSGDAIPPSDYYSVGPVKILPDERDLPAPEDIAERIHLARALSRSVAVHCVTAAELVVTLAAFEAAGALPGDRIEHGGVIPEALFGRIRSLGLTVVTQPNFVYDRGDRYLASVDPAELPDLYRLASLREAGIALAAGSDAPYGGFDPWRAVKAAAARTTRGGQSLGAAECLRVRDALDLYLGPAALPGGGAREITVGAAADLCLLGVPLSEALADPRMETVAATISRGSVIYTAD